MVIRFGGIFLKFSWTGLTDNEVGILKHEDLRYKLTEASCICDVVDPVNYHPARQEDLCTLADRHWNSWKA